MKTILLIGLGQFGRQIAMKLHEMNQQVMAVDKISERVDQILPYVTGALIGDSTNIEFMKTLGVRDFDVCIVAIGDDFQASLETTSLLKELEATMVVSRAEQDVQAKFLLRNGADEIVFPEKQLANWTAIRYSSEHIFDYIELSDDYAIIEVEVPENWRNRKIGEINIRNKYKINIMAIRRMDKLELTISADTMLAAGDNIMVLGSYRDIQKCFRI